MDLERSEIAAICSYPILRSSLESFRRYGKRASPNRRDSASSPKVVRASI